MDAGLQDPAEVQHQRLPPTGVHDPTAAPLDPAGGDVNGPGHPLGAEDGRVGKAHVAVEEERDPVAIHQDRQKASRPSPLIKIDHDIVHGSMVDPHDVQREFLADDDVVNEGARSSDIARYRRREPLSGPGADGGERCHRAPIPKTTKTSSARREAAAAFPSARCKRRPEVPRCAMTQAQRLCGYRVLGRLARGSTADILLATRDDVGARGAGRVPLGKHVVLKRLYPHLAVDEDFVRMFVDEIQLLSRFDQPSILKVYDLDDDGESFFAVLELVDGPSAAAALRVRAQRGVGPGVGEDVAVATALATADALGAVHGLRSAETGEALSLVHRDVTPHNVLLGRDGAVKLADFGVAKSDVARAAGVLRSKETTAGTRKGKVSYLSPEQVLGHHVGKPSAPVDQRSDLYALGATLYCLITGEPPFCADGDVALFDAIVQAPPPSIPGIDPVVGELVCALLEKSPSARPQTAAEVSGVLRAWWRGQPRPPSEAVAQMVQGLGLPTLG